MKNQIDPHITFNVLNSIGALYHRENDKEIAYKLLVKYSRLLRFAVQNSNKATISLSEELEFVKSYLELEQIRKDLSFDYRLNIDNSVDLTIKIPRMLIYSFVENAIKHGIRQLDRSGFLLIEVSSDSGICNITVRDDGPGLQNYTGKKEVSTGKGLQIVDELIRLFNRLEDLKIHYTLKELKSENHTSQGVEAKITIEG